MLKFIRARRYYSMIQRVKEKRWSIIQRHYPGLPRPEHLYFKEIEEKITHDSVVLEIGCGRRPGSGVEASVGGTRLFVGIDLCLEHLRHFLNKSTCMPVFGDAQIIPFKNSSFDLVFCRSVLEHIQYPESFVREIDRVLKPGGYFIFFTPNRWGYITIISRLLPDKLRANVVRMIHTREEQDIFKAYYLMNDKSQLRRLFKQTRLTEQRFIMKQQYPIDLWFSLVLLYAGILFERIVNKYSWLSFLRGNIIGCYSKRIE